VDITLAIEVGRDFSPALSINSGAFSSARSSEEKMVGTVVHAERIPCHCGNRRWYYIKTAL